MPDQKPAPSPDVVPVPAPSGRRGRPRVLRWGALVVVPAAALALLVGWHRSGARAEGGPGNDAPVLEGTYIRYSDAFRQRAGITTLEVKPSELSPVLSATGTLTWDPRRFAAIGARITARVRQLDKVPGDEVQAHEVLAELESAELGRAESAVLSARAKEKAAEAEMKRERKLADAQISAEREAEATAAAFQAARAERVAAERTVEALGGDLRGELGIMTLRSPIAGRVVSLGASRGQTLDPSATLYQVADLSVLWVELQVYERDVGAVRAGDEVELVPQAGGAIIGRVGQVGDVIDPDTRAATVRVVVPNAERLLRPGQSVAARIHASGPASRALAVPRQAVTRIDGKPTVFVSRGPNEVEPRLVSTGADDGKNVAVVAGLSEGEKIVLGGLFALKSEIYR